MEKFTSVLLGNHYDNFIHDEISSGRYHSADEIIRTSLRLLELEESKIKLLRQELASGEHSLMIDNFNPVQHLMELRKKHE
jgi:antitoxin ParD1/3/4